MRRSYARRRFSNGASAKPSSTTSGDNPKSRTANKQNSGMVTARLRQVSVHGSFSWSSILAKISETAPVGSLPPAGGTKNDSPVTNPCQDYQLMLALAGAAAGAAWIGLSRFEKPSLRTRTLYCP